MSFIPCRWNWEWRTAFITNLKLTTHLIIMNIKDVLQFSWINDLRCGHCQWRSYGGEGDRGQQFHPTLPRKIYILIHHVLCEKFFLAGKNFEFLPSPQKFAPPLENIPATPLAQVPHFSTKMLTVQLPGVAPGEGIGGCTPPHQHENLRILRSRFCMTCVV